MPLVLLGGEGYAGVIQRFVVAPNEQARETPYIEHNIAATRACLRPRPGRRSASCPATPSSPARTSTRNRATLDNVRLWDHQPLLETFGQIQEIRTYYDFVSVDNDRYEIDGQTRQVMLSARELNPAALPNRTWINERLVFTHGHGITLGPVNQVTSEGLPVLFVRDLPPVSTVDINITEPSIYFGELSNDYVIARTKARRVPLSRRATTTSTSTTPAPAACRLDSFCQEAALRALLPLLPDPAERRHHDREPADVRPADPAARRRRSRRSCCSTRIPISSCTTGGCSGSRTPIPSTDRYPYSTAVDAGRELHPQLGEGGGRRLPRHDDVLPVDSRTIRSRRRCEDVFPDLFRPLTDMPDGPAPSRALSGRHLQPAGVGLRDVPHDQPGGLLQQGRPVGGAGDRPRRRVAAAWSRTTR